MTGGAEEKGGAGMASSLSILRTGIVLVAAGALITVVTYLRAAPGGRYFQMWGLILLGLGATLYGYLKARGAAASPPESARLRRHALAVLVCLLLSGGGWYAAWRYRAPFWSAVEALSKGNDAARALRTISERHVAKLQAARSGAEALDAWKRAAEEAIPLRADFAAASKAAGYLRAEDGPLRERAEIDAKFFPLCLEWIDLYDEVARRTATESMQEPPVEWETRHDDLVDRIESLPSPPAEGS